MIELVDYKKECIKIDAFTEIGESLRKVVDQELRKEGTSIEEL